MAEQENQGTCGCGNLLDKDAVFDKLFNKTVCWSCYQLAFREAETHAWGEWFEANFKDNKSAYSPEFWRSVGAFVDVSKCGPSDPYK